MSKAVRCIYMFRGMGGKGAVIGVGATKSVALPNGDDDLVVVVIKKKMQVCRLNVAPIWYQTHQ